MDFALWKAARLHLGAFGVITQVELAAARPYEISVEVSESALRRYGLSFDEVGRVLGIAPGTAKVRSHRALKKIRSQLDDQGGSP